MSIETYGVAYEFCVSLVDQASRPQFKASPTIAAGDFKVSVAGAALANLTTLPTVYPAGSKSVRIQLSAAEMTGENISVIGSDVAGAEWDDIFICLTPEPVVRAANLTQIDGAATSGNNATLYLKSLNLRSNSATVDAFRIEGYSEPSAGHGGNALNIIGGVGRTAGYAGGNAITIEGGHAVSGASKGFSLRSVASGAGGGLGVSLEGYYAASPFDIYTDGYTSKPSLNVNVAGSVGSLNTQAKADVNAEVKDVLETDTQAEPTSPPASTASLKDKIAWLFTLGKNKRTQTTTTETVLADDGTTPIATSAKSDTGTTFTRGKFQ